MLIQGEEMVTPAVLAAMENTPDPRRRGQAGRQVFKVVR